MDGNEPPTFNEDIRHILNKHSMDAETDTPDFILADFLESVIQDLARLNRRTKTFL